MIKTEYKPYLIVLLLFTIHYLSGYPGGMSPDTFHQFAQSLAFKFNSHHPPLMAMLWAMFHKIYPGPQTMLFLHLSLLWGGVLFLYNSDPSNRYRWMYFVIPFLPNVLSQSTMIWKDVAFALCFFFVVSVCVFYTYRQKLAPIYISLLLLLLTFYGMAVKFQAQFIVPLLVYWIVTISVHARFYIKLLATAFTSILLIYANLSITDKYSVNTNSWQLRQVFDLAGIVVQIDDDSILPEYIREGELYSLEKVKKYYTAKWVDPLFFYEESKIFGFTFDEDNLHALNSAFNNAITKQPIQYLYHRLLVFTHTLNSCKYYMYGFIEKSDAEIYSIHYLKKNRLKNFFTKNIKLFPKFLAANWVSLLLILFYLYNYFKLRPNTARSAELLSIRNITLISLSYTLVLLFTTMSSDYRYYYFVRLLSFFALPIYLNLRKNQKEKA